MIQVKKSNIRYIDYFKALLIITVVLAHINYANDGIKPWVMFNMPAFFFASGTLLKGLKGREPGAMKKTLEKKLLRLMLPYFLWALIYSSLSISNLLRIAYGSHYMLSKAGSLSSLWFLPTLFLADLLFHLLAFAFGERMNGRVKLILAIVSFAIAPVLPNLKYGWPWCVNVAFSAFGFLMLGHLLFPVLQRSRELIAASRKGIAAGVCVLCLSFLGTLLYKFNISESMEYVLIAESRYGNYGLFLLVSCMGTVFVITLAMLLDIFVPARIMERFDPLAFIGQNTLLIFGLNKFFIQCFKIVFRFVHVGTTLTLILTCIGTLIACFPCIIFINKYIPVLAGKVKTE